MEIAYTLNDYTRGISQKAITQPGNILVFAPTVVGDGILSFLPSDAGRAKMDGIVEEAIMDMEAYQPSTNTRAVARQLQASQSTTWRVLKEECLHLYHAQGVQELIQEVYPRCGEFAYWFLQPNAVNPDFDATVLFTDECTFTREDAFNSRNQHVGAEVNLHATCPHSHQRRFSINVWARIIGDNLLDGEKRLTSLQQVLPDMLNDGSSHIRWVMWFQEDGAPAHYVRAMGNYLDVTFPSQWITEVVLQLGHGDRQIFHVSISFCGDSGRFICKRFPLNLPKNLSPSIRRSRSLFGIFIVITCH